MNECILSPSLLSSDFARLDEELTALEQAGIPWVHWDVMDGQFVPNITLGPPVIKAARSKSSLFFDVHLMVQDPGRYIEDFAAAGADLIGVHAEACLHLERVISQIAETGAQSAIALNPATPLSHIDYLLPQLDMVLIMSVNPGFGGQSFIPFCLEKIKALRARLDILGLATRIQVDGGVTLDNTAAITAAGADTLVSGSAFFKHDSYREGLRRFLQQAGQE
ncbi:MAG: ribulose-phosphate 3-epimerase [Thermodesulfobacteriota bacterium]